MASKDDHLWQADHNEALYNQLLTTKFLDWVVTAIFYSALHYVDAYLATKDIHPPTHQVRTPLLERESNLRQIYSQYRRLKDKSEAARYRVKHFTKSDVAGFKENQFEVIKSHISNYL